MPFPKHRLAAIALCTLPVLAHGALFEVHVPVGDFPAIRHAAQARLPEAWQPTGVAHSAGFQPGRAVHSPAAQVLRVANPAGVASMAESAPIIDAGQEVRGIDPDEPPADSDQKPGFWTFVVLGAGLVAYQLRRQERNRSGMIRFPH